MNMSFGSPLSAQHRLKQIQQELESITQWIQQNHTQMNQRKLKRQARKWGWDIEFAGSNHFCKAVREGYAKVSISGHGQGRPLRSGTAFKTLQALATPVRQQLESEAIELQKQLSENTLSVLQQQTSLQEETIKTQQHQISLLEADLEVGLALAAEVEISNTRLMRQVTDLMHQRLELEAAKRRIGQLIQQYAELEQQLFSFVGRVERQELMVQQIVEVAQALPETMPLKQHLLTILDQSGDVAWV